MNDFFYFAETPTSILPAYPEFADRQQGVNFFFGTPGGVAWKTVFQGRQGNAVIQILLLITRWDISG